MTTENNKASKQSNIQVKEMQIDTKKPQRSSPGFSESPIPANYDMSKENKPTKQKLPDQDPYSQKNVNKTPNSNNNI